MFQMEKKIFEETNRKQFCSIDRWIDMTMDDIRDLEARTKEELDKVRKILFISRMVVFFYSNPSSQQFVA